MTRSEEGSPAPEPGRHPDGTPGHQPGPATRSFAAPPYQAAQASADTVQAGVPPRPNPLPPPRPNAGAPSSGLPPRGPARSPAAGAAPPQASRPAGRGRRARLTLRRIDPWSVFLFSVVASIFLGLALLVCVAVLFFVLSNLGVLDSINELIGDVTSEPGEEATPSDAFSGGRIMSVAVVVAAVDVVLITALATLSAFLYNLCAALTGGIEVTLGDRE